ncbi:MAG: YebC/PmpR family DNA-binding transcriptional regulator [Phycisphaerales bacterium]|nr:YebC/PmpR family DNA-binding transcriptional regulator [Phycisphaerales bacterium]
MAGHSAWKNIKRRKAVVDAKRGKVWSKVGRAISVAARAGGGDVRFNAGLRLAIEDAKAANMPRDTIEKAVKKGAGGLDGETFHTIRYEGYGAGGVAVIVECLTSNLNRTAGDIRVIFDKNGGNLGVPGSVAFGFQLLGVLMVDAAVIGEEQVMDAVVAAGGDDVTREDESWQITCAPGAVTAVSDALEARQAAPTETQVMWVPSTTVEVEGERAALVTRLIEALEENDDVQKVFSNAVFGD